jgi:regulatory protein YycI of two-component signal transduction system YycFG
LPPFGLARKGTFVLLKSRFLILFLTIVFLLVLIRMGPQVLAQNTPRTPAQIEKDMEDQRLKEANLKRQQDLRADTDRLLQLATELKAAVDKSNENLLSLDVLRKADEVEKLARRVREKMKDGIGPGPRTEPTGNPRVPGRPPG